MKFNSTTLPHWEWSILCDSLPKNRVGKEKKLTLKKRNLANTTLPKWAKQTSPGISRGWLSVYIVSWCDKNGTLPLWILPQTPQPQSKNEKNIKQTQIEGILQYLTSPPQNCSRSWKSRKDWELRAKETWQLNAIWYPGLDPRTERGHQRKKIGGEGRPVSSVD